MPRALRSLVKTNTKKNSQWEPSKGTVAIRIPKPPRGRDSATLITKVFFTLWTRLLKSYQSTPSSPFFSSSSSSSSSSSYDSPDNLPFVVMNNNSQILTDNKELNNTDDNKDWQSAFGCNTNMEAMIFHLYYIFVDIDASAWIIAFCIIDKLQLRYSVYKHTKKVINNSFNKNLSFFIFDLNKCWRNLFVAYSLALKWHLDYNVTINYMIDLLPNASQNSQHLLRNSVLTELEMLQSLDYDVYIRPEELFQLLDYFLTPDERECVIRAITK